MLERVADCLDQLAYEGNMQYIKMQTYHPTLFGSIASTSVPKKKAYSEISIQTEVSYHSNL